MSGTWSTHPAFAATPNKHFFSTTEPITQSTIYSAVNLWLQNKSMAIKAYGDINSWEFDSTNPVTDMSGLFKNKSSFNDNISNWDTSKVTDMSNMFKGATTFNQNIATNIHKWNVEKVKNMENMFNGAIAFNQDITDWNVGQVTNMNNMFYGATTFNQNIICRLEPGCVQFLQMTVIARYVFTGATYDGMATFGTETGMGCVTISAALFTTI